MNTTKSKLTPTKKPWNDKRGRRLPIDELRIVSQTWDRATWDAYLETVESPLREQLVDDFDAVLSEYARRQEEVCEPDNEEMEQTFQKIDAAISMLPPMEKAILQGICWDHLSLRDLAHAYGISRNTIAKRYKKTLQLTRGNM